MPPKPLERHANTGRVSDAALRTAKPGTRPYKIAAGGGLYLEVTPSGSKLWRWKYRFGGRENRFAVRAYPTVPLKEARARAEEARTLVKAGIHPSHQKQLNRIKAGHERANTFEAIAYEWLALKDWEEVTKARRLAMLKRVVFPAIGKLPVRQITPAHILDILKRTARTGPTVAAEAKRTMSGIFELAVSTLRAETDPVYPVRKALPANKTQHKRALSAEEIGQLMRNLDDYPGYRFGVSPDVVDAVPPERGYRGAMGRG
jgi:Arm DNA-binding domain/Phage integrase central domain